MSRRDPGAAKGNREYPIQRGPCACSHAEVAHLFRMVARRKVRGPCSVMSPAGRCGCRDYSESPVAPQTATAEEKLRRIWELHTDSVAGVCPSCGRIGEQSDTDDGLVAWPCPTILAIDPDAATKYGPVRHG